MDADRRTRVLVADEQPLLRLGIRGELEDAGYVVCAEAETAPEALSAALREKPDVCLLDASLPGDGLRAARAIAACLPETKVVLLVEQAAVPGMVEALEAGTAGFVEKDLDPARLPELLAAVLTGEPVIPRRLVGEVIAHMLTR